MRSDAASTHTRLLTHLAGGALLLATSASMSACFGGGEGVFLEAEDVSLDMPTRASEFRAEGDIRGDAWWLITHTATDVDSWVTTVVETSAYIVEFLDDHPATTRDGAWRVYGPFDDERGRDLAWIVRISGGDTDTNFEFLVADKGTTEPDAFVSMVEGGLTIEGDLRSGSMHIDFDTIEAHDDLDETLAWDYAGDITIEFQRNVDSGDKHIDLNFDGFVAEHKGYLDDDRFESDESYRYTREGDGSGSFFLALDGEWDTYPHGWSGPERERMQLDMIWDSDGRGRARGTIEAGEEGGDMLHGDLALEECFDGQGYLSWRELSELYAAEVPGYNFGTADSCVFTTDDLD